MTVPNPQNRKSEGVSPLLLVIFGLAALFLAGALMFWLYQNGRDDAVALQSLPPFSDTSGSADAPPNRILDELVKEGGVAPDFELATLSGETVRLSDYAGRPVILNFWATWCAPCRVEMPELQRAYDRFGADGPVILTINQEESAEQVGEFFADVGLTLPALLDPKGRVGLTYGAVFLPTTVVVDPDGIVTKIHRGMISGDAIDGYLERFTPSEGS